MRSIVPLAENEFRTLKLGDARRVKRAKMLLSAMLEAPRASIPAACREKAEIKAAYRFLGSDVDPEALRAAHADATAERARGMKRVLVAQDTTSLDYTCCPGTRGLGPLDSTFCRGLMVQSLLVMDEKGRPLGLIDQRVWAREEGERKKGTRRTRPPQEKESWRWREGFEAVQRRIPEETEVIGIADRESDIYFVLAMPRRRGMHLLIRSAHDRAVAGEHGRLRAEVAAAPVLGSYTATLQRTHNHDPREATLEVQAASVVLEAPRHGTNGQNAAKEVEVTAVLVREVGKMLKGQKPIEWLLLATWPVQTLEEAVECARMYGHRWKVERYHYVLKSGCEIEDLQLETADRLERALAFYSIVATRLLWLSYGSRSEPDAPCTVALEEGEWRVLSVMSGKKNLRHPPTLRDAVHMIARLGGFMGRKLDGEPGVKTLWYGWRRLQDFVLASRLLAPTHDVGNG
jgi:hypothetical protein